jgi:hypothetical protein
MIEIENVKLKIENTTPHVIPVNTGIQDKRFTITATLDSCLRRNDGGGAK